MSHRTISHYEVLGELGHGGMGVVYKARDIHLDRFVAIKILPPESVTDPERRNRFVQEAKTASALNHPNIITVYDIDSAEGVDFIAMEYVGGKSLAELVGPEGLPIEEVLAYAIQMADAICKAHGAGIIHRDLKPSNVMVTAEGQVKVLDFGLAKLVLREAQGASATATSPANLTSPGQTIGTLAYMSPEQARGEGLDTRSDLFSYGAVLYEMVTGHQAFCGNTPAMIYDAILHQRPTSPLRWNPEVPDKFEDIIGRALEKDRGLRYQSASDLLADLQRVKRELDATGVDAQARLERIRSLAVLPLANLSRDPEQEYFTEGMTEALITDLAKISALRVVSRTSAMRYKGSTKPLPEIARELKVDAVVEGSVLKVGERVRVTAQLIHAPTDSHLWADSYDRDLRDILALQSEVAQAIAREIKIKVTPEERNRLATVRLVDPVAHEKYLRARFVYGWHTAEGFKRAIQYFQESIAADPGYAPAYAGLASAYLFLSGPLTQVLPTSETLPKARAAALRALELDDKLALAHASVARVKMYEWDWNGSEREFRRAMELDPNDTFAYIGFNFLLIILGRFDEAIAVARRAVELDPLHLLGHVALSWALFYARRYDEAIEEARNVLELDPRYAVAHCNIAMSSYGKGDYEAAVAEMEKAAPLTEGEPLAKGLVGGMFARTDRRQEALQMLKELEDMARTKYVPSYIRAVIYFGLGDLDHAFEMLERAYQEREMSMAFMKTFPLWDAIRPDPRYHDLIRRMGLTG